MAAQTLSFGSRKTGQAESQSLRPPGAAEVDGAEAGVSVARLPGFSPDGPTGNPFPALHQPQKPVHRTRRFDPPERGRYMRPEIAPTKGSGGIAWLDPPEREDEERPELVVDALAVWKGEVVADLGAESGYFTFRIAPKVGGTGKELAVGIQDEVLETMLVGTGFLPNSPEASVRPFLWSAPIPRCYMQAGSRSYRGGHDCHGSAAVSRTRPTMSSRQWFGSGWSTTLP